MMTRRYPLPDRGASHEEVMHRLEAMKADDCAWQRGRLPLYVYWFDEELHRVSKDAYMSFFTGNALGRKAFPSVVELEAQVLDIALERFQAP